MADRSSVRMMVHGGAGAIPDDLLVPFRHGCCEAARRGHAVLLAGGSALDAVEAAVRLLENDEHFDAGRGSHLNLDGVVSMDAGIMEGTHLALGAVAGVRDIANPITLARRVLESPHTLLIGEGASLFAEAHGMARCDPRSLVVAREWADLEAYLRERAAQTRGAISDTVGAIARDAWGHLAAAVSTGGRKFATPGRVGDVPIAGSGFYADDQLGAAVSTGEGEQIVRIIMAKRAVDALAAGGEPRAAAEEAIAHLGARVDGVGGIIVMDPRGRMGWAYNTLRMGRAWVEPDGRVVCLVNRED